MEGRTIQEERSGDTRGRLKVTVGAHRGDVVLVVGDQRALLTPEGARELVHGLIDACSRADESAVATLIADLIAPPPPSQLRQARATVREVRGG